MNGLANGNGNDNGNNNGNVVLQIFNVPVSEDHIIRPTTTDPPATEETTGTWYTIWTPSTEGQTTNTPSPATDVQTTPEVWWTTVPV